MLQFEVAEYQPVDCPPRGDESHKLIVLYKNGAEVGSYHVDPSLPYEALKLAVDISRHSPGIQVPSILGSGNVGEFGWDLVNRAIAFTKTWKDRYGDLMVLRYRRQKRWLWGGESRVLFVVNDLQGPLAFVESSSPGKEESDLVNAFSGALGWALLSRTCTPETEIVLPPRSYDRLAKGVSAIPFAKGSHPSRWNDRFGAV